MTKRRGRGEGSVYRRKDGRCVGEYEDANVKRRYVSGKTKAEVRTKPRKLLFDGDVGIGYEGENLTVGGHLDRWLDAVKGSVRERTFTDATSEGRALGSWSLWCAGLRERAGDGLLESHCPPLGSRFLEGRLAQLGARSSQFAIVFERTAGI